MPEIFEQRFKEWKEMESRGCLRCKNYAGYGVYKIRDLPKGKVLWGTRVSCKVNKCQPLLNPITCNYCGTNLEESLSKVKDKELQQTLKEMGMCSGCYEEWREECLCLLCAFDYPSSSIRGKKGNYCFCIACEWNDRCPEKRKSFLECADTREISKEKIEKILECL